MSVKHNSANLISTVMSVRLLSCHWQPQPHTRIHTHTHTHTQPYAEFCREKVEHSNCQKARVKRQLHLERGNKVKKLVRQQKQTDKKQKIHMKSAEKKNK